MDRGPKKSLEGKSRAVLKFFLLARVSLNPRAERTCHEILTLVLPLGGVPGVGTTVLSLFSHYTVGPGGITAPRVVVEPAPLLRKESCKHFEILWGITERTGNTLCFCRCQLVDGVSSLK